MTKELNLLDSLAPQTGRTQRSFLILALYQLTVPATVTSALPTQTFESELTGHFQLFITKDRIHVFFLFFFFPEEPLFGTKENFIPNGSY